MSVLVKSKLRHGPGAICSLSALLTSLILVSLQNNVNQHVWCHKRWKQYKENKNSRLENADALILIDGWRNCTGLHSFIYDHSPAKLRAQSK